MNIKKYIEVPEEIFIRIAEGKCVQGSIKRDPYSGKLVFKPHNIAEYVTGYHRRQPDKLLASLEHGWLKESAKCIKYYCAVKKSIGIPRIISAMEREQKIATGHLMDREIVDRV